MAMSLEYRISVKATVMATAANAKSGGVRQGSVKLSVEVGLAGVLRPPANDHMR
jgi:hypothetical protein